MSVEEYFSTGPPHERPIYDAVMRHLESVGPVHVEPVSVGIFLKRAQTFAQLRPKDRWVTLYFVVPRKVEHERITRKAIQSGRQYWHAANLRTPDELDERLRDFLTEAYLQSPA
jgi:hypothetical protein